MSARSYAPFSTFFLLSAAACNAIVGVEDVTLAEPRPVDVDEPTDDDEEPDEGAAKTPDGLQLALGEQHSCARSSSGKVQCWGDDTRGQTGTDAANDDGIVPAPTEVLGVSDAIDIAAGRNHTCVARKSGGVSCWGYNFDGQLGNGESANRRSTPVEVVGLKGAVAVAAGANFSCALRSGGSVACWGANGSGQLGTGDELPSVTPVAVAGVSQAVAIAAGQSHACAVNTDGTVACWGDGAHGQLGAGDSASSSLPVTVRSITDAVTVAAAARSTCALTRRGSVMCWGANEVGQLGTGTTHSAPSPTPVANLSDASAISAGYEHVCARTARGSVVCWGNGTRGQLGDGVRRTGGTSSNVPVAGIRSGKGVAAGGNHSCAPTDARTILCWGANDRQQLGNDGTEDAFSPSSVKGAF